MRCFCCDAPASFDDKPTGRSYCNTCWDVIEQLILGLNDTEEEMFEGVYDDGEEEGQVDAPEVSSVWP